MKIWTNHDFTDGAESTLDELRAALDARYELQVFPPFDDGTSGAAKDALEIADIAFGTPDADQVLAAENIRWLQVNLAGYTPYDRADFKENFRVQRRIMTNSSSVYVEPCAQHVLAMIMALARRLPASLDEQRGARNWTDEATRRESYLLNEQTAVILGFGTIGRRVAELLAPLKMNVYGFRRTISGDEPAAMISEADLGEILARADHVINILPASGATNGFMSAARFAQMKPGARFYNIGRGATVDQDALLHALETERVAAAYLDVMTPEPLPAAHPFWTLPNCFITPHSAGGFSLEKQRHVRHFLENLKRFETNAAMLDRIY